METRSARAFLEAFASRFATERENYTNGGCADWTELMYRVLHQVKDDLKLWCECKMAEHHEKQPGTVRGERLHIDFFWYHRVPGHETRAKSVEEVYQPPCIVIEHENADARLEYNLWKLSQLAAPLRVLIGYSKVRGRKKVERRVTTLIEMARSANLFTPVETEDLWLLSDDAPSKTFSAWRRPVGGSWSDVEPFDIK